MKKIKIKYHFVAMFLSIALIRVILFWGASIDWQRAILVDSPGYLTLAQNILENGVFSRSAEPPYAPETLRTPGYPFFLALIMSIFGENNYAAIIIFQLIISLLIGALIFRTALVFLGRKSAYFAGWLYAFGLPSAAYNIYIHTETLFTILLLLSFTALFSFLKSKRIFYLYISGLWAGLAALCRPIAVYFFIPAAVIILAGFHARGFLGRLKYAGIWSLIFFILVGGWFARNYSQTGMWVFTDAQEHTLSFWAQHAFAQAEGVQFSKNIVDRFNRNLLKKTTDKKLSPAEKDKYSRKYALEIIRKTPRHFLVVELIGMGKLLFAPGRITVGRLLGLIPMNTSTDVLGTVSSQEIRRAFRMIFISTSHLLWIAGVNWLYLIVVYGLACLGIPYLYRHQRPLLFALAAVLFYFILLSGVPGADSRLRVPMMPYILILAAAGIAQIQAMKKTF